jgi:uncharacterized protein
MAREIFVNLPVHDLPRSRAFFAALGFGFNEQFSNEVAACMVVTDSIYVMLLTVPFFQSFTDKPVADATKSVQVLLALSCDSRAEVDALVAKAVAAGATTPRPPVDMGFMYSHDFEDLDGHVWEPFQMDASAMPPAQ